MKKKIFSLSIIILLLASLTSCKTNDRIQLSDTALNNIADSFKNALLNEETVSMEAIEADPWINHYYNRGIYEKDGFTYRQFNDGLYRRQSGTDNWEQLCKIPIDVGRGLTAYGERIYFTCYMEEYDTQQTGWNNSVFYFDLDTMEYGKLLSMETLISTVVVYDSCLYLQYMEEGYMQYIGYQLDENGTIKEKLDTESEDFLCYEQNQYNIAEYETMGTSHRRNTFVNPYEIVSQAKSEIISLPYCASMLGGKVILKQRNDESSCHYFLRDLKKGEDTFLFDADSVLFIIPDGILYFANIGNTLMYYSFTNRLSQEISLPEFWEVDTIYMDYYLTYNEKALYFYNFGYSSEASQILQLSLEDWSVETVAEGEVLSDTDAPRMNQVDREYFYHGDQMFMIP